MKHNHRRVFQRSYHTLALSFINSGSEPDEYGMNRLLVTILQEVRILLLNIDILLIRAIGQNFI